MRLNGMPRDKMVRRKRARLSAPSVSEELDPAPNVKTMLDSRMFPHIMDAIVDCASHASLISLRAVCRSFRRRCDRLLARHLILHTDEQVDTEFQIDDHIPVSIVGPGGRLPMFMNWCNELHPAIWKCFGEEWPETYDDWVQVTVPKVLYPAMVSHLEKQNSRTRAIRLMDLLAHAEVIDLVGPLPLNRIRELMSALPSSSRAMLRIRPDGDQCSPWTPTSNEFSNLNLEEYIEGRAHRWDIEWLWTERIDTLVHFESITVYDNVELLSEVHAAGLRLFSPLVRRLVIHFSMMESEIPHVWSWRHRLGYKVHSSVEEIVVIFEVDPPFLYDHHEVVSIMPENGSDDGNEGNEGMEPLRRFFRDIGEYMPQTKVTLVNTRDLYPQLIGLPRTTPRSKMPKLCTDYFIASVPPQARADEAAMRLDVITLKEYEERIGSERFKLETDGYENNFWSIFDGTFADFMLHGERTEKSPDDLMKGGPEFDVNWPPLPSSGEPSVDTASSVTLNMSSFTTRRLMKELADIRNNGTPEGIAAYSIDRMDEWVFTISVLGDETVYRGEKFALRLRFGERYPIEFPSVTFLNNGEFKPPVHPHIYTNGHVCASILGPEWSPVLTALSVCITMQSMLASCKKKELPRGNDSYVRRAPDDPRLTRWEYHDDTV